MRAQLVILPNDEVKLLLHDLSGRGRIQIALGSDGIAGLTLFHDNDKPHFMLANDGKGDAGMFFVDQNGRKVCLNV